MKEQDEFKKDSCPHCGKEVLVQLNVPFFGDPRVCSNCQQKMSGVFNCVKEQDERERLISEIGRTIFYQGSPSKINRQHAEVLSYFILADRRRCLEEVEKVLNEPVLYDVYTTEGISKYHFDRIRRCLSIIKTLKG